MLEVILYQKYEINKFDLKKENNFKCDGPYHYWACKEMLYSGWAQ